MNTQKLKYTFDTAVTNIQDLNKAFALGTLKVGYTGLNYNGSSISKEAFELSASTMFNVPIVANYSVVDDTIGEHDEGFVTTADEQIRYVVFTEPVGVVPESATYRWEQIEDDGVVHDYFCIDNVILWKRQACYNKIENNGITAQSMEIAINDGNLSDGVLHINSFEFEAFCLLESAEPCYEQASLELYSKNEFKTQMKEMIEEYHNTVMNDESKIGGTKVENPISTMTNEPQQIESAQGFNKDTNPEIIKETTEFSLTANELRERLRAGLSEISRDGCVEDFDNEYVYIYDWEDGCIYKYSYTIIDGSAVIDENTEKKQMLQYVDYDEGESDTSPLPIAGIVDEAVAQTKQTVTEEYSEKINDLTTELASANTELSTLREFKQNTLKEARNTQVAEIFSRFDTVLGNVEEYNTLKENEAKYEIEDIEQQCFALFGKQSFSSHKNEVHELDTSIRMPVDKFSVQERDNTYGGLLQHK